MWDFAKALEVVQNRIGAECIVTNIDTRPYGWMFDSMPKDYVETGDVGLTPIGGGPTFVSKLGEIIELGSGEYPWKLVLKNWEVAHPDYVIPKSHFNGLDNETILDEDDEQQLMRHVNATLILGVSDGAVKFKLQPDANLYRFQILRSEEVDSSITYRGLSNYALVVQRIKQMADIAPREKQSSETQTGTINLTLEEKKYRVTVTSTISEKREELHLAFESQ